MATLRKLSATRIESAIVNAVESRVGKTVCPSEIARALAPDAWRERMQEVRDVAARLAKQHKIVVTQKGRAVDLATVRGPVRLGAHPRHRTAYADAYRRVNFRAHPERYRVGKGEQGVLMAEPYKGELLPLWRFATPALATESSRALVKAFAAYKRAGEFVGMDMARKFLQMGFTRSRRYANHASGKKYALDGSVLPRGNGAEKAKSAEIFYAAWQRVEKDARYRREKAAWVKAATGYGTRGPKRNAAAPGKR